MRRKYSPFFSFFYDIAMFVMVLFYLPKLLRRLFNKQLPSIYFKNRLGFGLQDIKNNYKGAIWIHAVSLGEMKAIAPLVAKLKVEQPSASFIFSTSTMTGFEEAKKSYPKDGRFFLPIDFGFIIKPLVAKIKPRYLIFSETDLWYHLLQASYREKTFNIIASAKMSEKSASNYEKLPFFAKKLFSYIDLFCCQNALYLKRMEEIGITPSKLKVTGNLKYDVKYPKKSPEQILQFKKELGIIDCIVLGSTHQKEEEALLDVLPRDHTLVIVPRHPSRFDEVKSLLEKKNIPYYRISDPANRPEKFEVILVDAMGMLLQFYEVALLAIVCGSYQPIGGHNILEPLAYGTPVLFGPLMHTQFELVDLVLNAHAGLEVPIDHLRSTVDNLLSDPSKLKEMGENGKHLIDSLQGVTQRTLEQIHLLTLNTKK